jgi:hypothetical protein
MWRNQRPGEASPLSVARQRLIIRAARVAVAAMAAAVLAGCGAHGEAPRTTSAVGAPDAAAVAVAEAKELVQRHCVRCHLEPEPTDLSKEYWPYALHYMGNYVGMKGDEFPDMRTEDFPPEMEPVKDYTKRYFLYGNDGYFRDLYPFRAFIPPQPEMSAADFRKMREYFVANARSWREMEQQGPKPPLSPLFKPVVPNLDLEPDALVMSTLVDPARARIYVGRAVMDDWVGGGERRAGFEKWDDFILLDLNSGRRLQQVRVTSDPIEMAPTATGMRLVTHGRFPMSKEGIAQIVDWEFDGGRRKARMLVNGKQRFVMQRTADMNGDRLPDMVATAFGDGFMGMAQSLLAVYYQTPGYAKLWKTAPAEIPRGVLAGALREKILAEDAGLIANAIADFNQDGRPDIVALIAQGRQELFLLINNGDETFTRHLIDRHTPSWGGNSLQVADFDGDGDTDIEVLNGDNVNGNHIGKVVPAPRPQHGIRVFRNDDNLKFTPAFYYRLHGAIRSVVHDFDDDGDPDIAAISLFPQWSYDEPETFVYLENKGNFRFEPQSISRDFFSVWCSIEAADVNDDGRTDIVLGLGNYPELVPSDWITAHKAMQGRGGKAASVIYLLNLGRG